MDPPVRSKPKNSQRSHTAETRRHHRMVEFTDKQWKSLLLKNIRPYSRFSAVTRGSISEPNNRLSPMLLHYLFPVLKNATFVQSDRTLDSAVTGQFPLEGMLAFDTQHHGRVYVVVSKTYSGRQDQCLLYLGVYKDPRSADPGELAIITENKGKQSDTHELFLTMLIPYAPCGMCKKMSKTMLKCGRCWRETRFPVRYCSKQCQLAHFPLHKLCCGTTSLTPEQLLMPAIAKHLMLVILCPIRQM